MRALAITGPRARAAQLEPFRLAANEFRILEIPSPSAAAAALNEFSPDLVLLFGGDGTLNRHLGWMVDSAISVLPVPVGSGNDFAACHGIARLEDALQVFRRTVVNGVSGLADSDLGHAGFSGGVGRYFSCCLNVGLDADAARRTNHLPDLMKEHGGYFLGGLGAALFYSPRLLQLSASDGSPDIELPAWFVTVSNTPIFGGGLKIAPQARLDDGRLDVTFAPTAELGRAALLQHFPKILSGGHVGMTQLRIFTASHLRIGSPEGGPVYGDGEHLGELPVEVKVIPRAIKVLRGDLLPTAAI